MRSFKFYTICLILLALIFTTPAYAKNYLFFAPDGTIGGTAGKLDNIDQCNADNAGYDLVDKDAAIVVDQAGGRALFYNYDGDSVTAESDPGVVAPDYCDEPGAFGAGRWILVDIQTSGGLLTTLFAAKADESIVGTSLNADDLVNTAGVLETVSTIPHTNVAETLTVAWDLAGSDADSVTGIPLDSDFGSNGIMVRTGAGTYGIGTTFDIPMGGEDYILMGEAGSPYNAEQIAPAAALAAMVGDITTFDPCIGGDADCTDDGNDGWASTSIVNAYYTRIGDEVHYYVYVTGTGKADTEDPNVRLPFTISASTNYFIRSANCWTVNNTTQAISLGHDDTSGTELNIRNGVAIDAWTASVTRTVMCDFTYWTDD